MDSIQGIEANKIKKIGKWLPYEAKYYSGGEKIKNIGSLSQVSKIVWLRDSIEEIEVSKKIKKIGKWLQDEENIIVGEKKNRKYWQFVSG